MAPGKQTELFKLQLEIENFVANLRKALQEYTEFKKDLGKPIAVSLDKKSINSLAGVLKAQLQPIAEAFAAAANRGLQAVEGEGAKAIQRQTERAKGAAKEAADEQIKQSDRAKKERKEDEEEISEYQKSLARKRLAEINRIRKQGNQPPLQNYDDLLRADNKRKQPMFVAPDRVDKQLQIARDAKKVVDDKIAAEKSHYAWMASENKRREAEKSKSLKDQIDTEKAHRGWVDKQHATNLRTSEQARRQALRDQIATEKALDRNRRSNEKRVNKIFDASDKHDRQQANEDLKKTKKLIDQIGDAIKDGVNAHGRKTKEQLKLDKINQDAAALVRNLQKVKSELKDASKITLKIADTPAQLMRQNRSGEQYINRRGRGGYDDQIAELRELRRQEKKAEADQKRARNQALRENRDLLKAKQSIGLSVADTALRLGKWLIFYRLIHDITRVIETSIRSFVMGGIQYTKELELQRLALRGILAESFEVYSVQEDGQKKLLTGAAAVAALQGESVKQWQQLQAASLAVVGTTQDLMTLYSSILPYAVQLKKGTKEVQEITKATAVAASLMDVSFQDARSAIISLLQGRHLSRNRLVSSLGFNKQELENLKGQGKLFEEVQSRLDAFLALAPEAQQSLGAMSESFKEFMQIIGANAVTPILDLFRDMMNGRAGKNGMRGGGLSGMLFGDDPASKGLILRKEVQSTFEFVKGAAKDVALPIRQLGSDLRQTSQEDIQMMIVGLAEMGQAVTTVFTWFIKAGAWLATFVAQNRVLLKTVLMVGAAFGTYTAILNWGRALQRGSSQAGILEAGLNKLLTMLRLKVQITKEDTAATNANAAATKSASVQTGVFAATAKSLASAGVIGGLLVAFGLLTSKVFDYIQKLKDAKAAQDQLINGDRFGAIAQTSSLRSSDNAEDRFKGNRVFGAASDSAMGEFAKLEQNFDLLAGIGKQGADLQRIWKGLNDQQMSLSKELESGVAADSERFKQITERLAVLNRSKEAVRGLLSEIQNVSVAGIGSLDRDIDRNTQERDSVLGKANEIRADGNFKYSEKARQAFVNEAKALNSRIETQVADREKLAIRLRNADAQLLRFDRQDEVFLKPGHPSTGDDDGSSSGRKQFRSAAEDRLTRERILLESETKRLQAQYDAQLISEEQFIRQRDAIQSMGVELTIRMLAEKSKEWDAYRKKEKVSEDEHQDFLRGMGIERLQVEKEAEDLSIASLLAYNFRRKQLGEKHVETQLKIQERIAEIFGATAEDVETSLTRMANALEADLVRMGQTAAGAQKAVEPLRQIIKVASSYERSNKQVKNFGNALTNVKDRQQKLDQSFEAGRVSLASYADQTRENRAEMVRLLKAMETIYAQQLVMGGLGLLPLGSEETERIKQALADIRGELAHVQNAASSIDDAFQSWGGVVAVIDEVIGALGPLSGELSSVWGFVSKIAGSTAGIMKFAQAFKGMGAKLGEISGKGGKAKGFLSMFSGGIGMAEDGTATTTSAAIGGAALGASAALAVAATLYAKAVEKAKTSMSRSIENVTKAMQRGQMTLGAGIEKLEKQQFDNIRRYSKTKAGRTALKEILPQIQEQLEELRHRATEVRKEFDKNLSLARVGQGPFADFARMLFDLEKETAEYLGTFEEKSKGYKDALENVHELFEITLRAQREQLETQMDGFEAEAVGSAQRVIALVDEGLELQDSLRENEEARKKLLEDEAEILTDEAKAWKDHLSEREDYVNRILDIERQIADVIRQSSQEEADIRRRGILEAQESVAQVKARQISDVRGSKAAQLRQLRSDLRDAQSEATPTFDDELGEFKDRRGDMSKRQYELEKQRAELNRQVELNRIRLQTAQRIVNLEGQLFNISGTRYQLEAMAGENEVRRASRKLNEWRQTAALIDSIIRSGDGVIFNAPPGFPQIKVTIGQIIIDNKDQSQTVVPPPQGPGNGTPKPGPRTPDGERPDRPGPWTPNASPSLTQQRKTWGRQGLL